MRFIKKYKSYWNLKNFTSLLPVSRVLKFKRTKWKKIQIKLSARLAEKNTFLKEFPLPKKVLRCNYKYEYNDISYIAFLKQNNSDEKSIVLNSTKLAKYPNNVYDYLSTHKTAANGLRHFCRLSLSLRRSIFFLFNQKLSMRHFKNILKKKTINRESLFIELLIKPFFQLEVLLWKLGLFNSTAEIKQYFFKGLVLVNGTPVVQNLWLKQGDIITFKNICLKNVVALNTFLWSIAEIDYFTNTVVILLSYTDYNITNLPLLLREFINLGMFVDYIKNK